MKTPELKPKRDGRVRSSEIVMLRCRLTHEEHTLLMNILGMASNDPGDEDHAALQSLREKVRDGSPAQPNAEAQARGRLLGP